MLSERRCGTLTISSPFYRRLYAYLRERFPPLSFGLLIICFYSANQFLASALAHPGTPMRYTVDSLLGAVTVFCIFFLLRVSDEHKDYAEDARLHPGRVLHRGLISLADLRMLGALGMGTAFVLSAARGAAPFAAVVIALGFSFLMLKEFFSRDWLRGHFLLYAAAHMLIMPLIALVVYSFTTGDYPWTAPGWFWLYAFVRFFLFFDREISRKFRSSAEEIEGVDNYKKTLGTYGAVYAVLVLRLISTVMVTAVGFHLRLRPWFYLIPITLYGLSLVSCVRFRLSTGPRAAKIMKVYASVYLVAFDLALIFGIAGLYGFCVRP